MGLHKANPTEIYAGLSGGGARNAIRKDTTPCSIQRQASIASACHARWVTQLPATRMAH